jgi:hypothetical protein
MNSKTVGKAITKFLIGMIILLLILIAFTSCEKQDHLCDDDDVAGKALVGHWKSEDGIMTWDVGYQIMEVKIHNESEQLNHYLSFTWNLIERGGNYTLLIYNEGYPIVFSSEVPYSPFHKLTIYNVDWLDCDISDPENVRCQEEWTLVRQ